MRLPQPQRVNNAELSDVSTSIRVYLLRVAARRRGAELGPERPHADAASEASHP